MPKCIHVLRSQMDVGRCNASQFFTKALCVLKSHLASSEVKDVIDQDALHGEEPAQHSGGVPQVTKLHVDLFEKFVKGAHDLI